MRVPSRNRATTSSSPPSRRVIAGSDSHSRRTSPLRRLAKLGVALGIAVPFAFNVLPSPVQAQTAAPSARPSGPLDACVDVLGAVQVEVGDCPPPAANTPAPVNQPAPTPAPAAPTPAAAVVNVPSVLDVNADVELHVLDTNTPAAPVAVPNIAPAAPAA